MKAMRIMALVAVATSAAACGDLDVVNLNDPDRERAISTPSDVESLISGSFAAWWQSGHANGAGIAFSVAADAHTSSWGNFAMQDMGAEPRIPYNNEPSYGYAYVARDPWTFSYRALAGVRDGLRSIDGGIEIGDGGEDTNRARAFGAFVQGLAFGHLALTYDQAFVVDETTDTDPANPPQLVPWPEVLEASLAKLDQAISLSGASYTIPSDWVGGVRDLSNSEIAALAHGYKARFMIAAPRDPAGRDAVNWQQVLDEVNQAHDWDFETVYLGSGPFYDRLKVHGGGLEGWGRMDLRMLGPAHAGSEWRDWEAAAPNDRSPFLIDTDDRRVTGVDGPTSAGLYVRYLTGIPFRPERGTYHFSNYSDNRYRPLWTSPTYQGANNGEFPVKELDFIRAEALYRLGNLQGAADIINQYRTTNGELPAVTVAGAPVSDRCVPKTLTGACGDLWEALKYDKRIEVWHYGYGTEFFDDRGWGDLVSGTLVHLAIPGAELETLLMAIYTFGGGGAGSAP